MKTASPLAVKSKGYITQTLFLVAAIVWCIPYLLVYPSYGAWDPQAEITQKDSDSNDLRKTYRDLLDPLSYLSTPRSPFQTQKTLWLGASKGGTHRYGSEKTKEWLTKYRERLYQQIDPIEETYKTLRSQVSSAQPLSALAEAFRKSGWLETSNDLSIKKAFEPFTREELLSNAETLFQIAVDYPRGLEFELVDTVRLVFKMLGQPYILVDQGAKFREENRIIGIDPLHLVFRVIQSKPAEQLTSSGQAQPTPTSGVEYYPLVAILERLREFETADLAAKAAPHQARWTEMNTRLENARLRAIAALERDLIRVQSLPSDGYQKKLVVVALKRALEKARKIRFRVKKDGFESDAVNGELAFVLETLNSQGQLIDTWTVPCAALIKGRGQK